jgi:hypothetical protein
MSLAPLLEKQRCNSLHKLRASQIKLYKAMGKEEESDVKFKSTYGSPFKYKVYKSPIRNRNNIDLSAKSIEMIKSSASKRVTINSFIKTGTINANNPPNASKLLNQTQYKDVKKVFPKRINDLLGSLGINGNIDHYILDKVKDCSKRSEKIYALKRSITMQPSDKDEYKAPKIKLNRKDIEDLNEWMCSMLVYCDGLSDNADEYNKAVLLYALREILFQVSSVCNEAGILLQSIVYMLLNSYIKVSVSLGV